MTVLTAQNIETESNIRRRREWRRLEAYLDRGPISQGAPIIQRFAEPLDEPSDAPTRRRPVRGLVGRTIISLRVRRRINRRLRALGSHPRTW